MKNRVFWIDPRQGDQGASPVVNVGEVIAIGESGVYVDHGGVRHYVNGSACHTSPQAAVQAVDSELQPQV